MIWSSWLELSKQNVRVSLPAVPLYKHSYRWYMCSAHFKSHLYVWKIFLHSPWRFDLYWIEIPRDDYFLIFFISKYIRRWRVKMRMVGILMFSFPFSSRRVKKCWNSRMGDWRYLVEFEECKTTPTELYFLCSIVVRRGIEATTFYTERN